MSHIKDYLMDIEEGRIVPGQLQDKCVCSNHFSDIGLRSLIEQRGEPGICSYCGEANTVMNMSDFVRMVSGKLEAEFDDVDGAMLPLTKSEFDDECIPSCAQFHGYAVPSYCKRFDDTEEVLNTLLGLIESEALLNDIVGTLPEHGWISKYPFLASLDDELNLKWNQFSKMVKHRQRFTFLANREFKCQSSEYSSSVLGILSELGAMIHTFGLCKSLDRCTVIYRGTRPLFRMAR